MASSSGSSTRGYFRAEVRTSGPAPRGISLVFKKYNAHYQPIECLLCGEERHEDIIAPAPTAEGLVGQLKHEKGPLLWACKAFFDDEYVDFKKWVPVVVSELRQHPKLVLETPLDLLERQVADAAAQLQFRLKIKAAVLALA